MEAEKITENEKYLKVLVMLQMLIFEIEDLDSTKVLVMEEKRRANMLKESILKRHKKAIDGLWKTEGGEQTHMDLFEIYEKVVKNLCEMKIDRLPLFLEMTEGLKNGTVVVKEG